MEVRDLARVLCRVCQRAGADPSDVGLVLSGHGADGWNLLRVCRECVDRWRLGPQWAELLSGIEGARAATARGVAPGGEGPANDVAPPDLGRRVAELEGFAGELVEALRAELALREPPREVLWSRLPQEVRDQWGSLEAFAELPPSPASAFSPGLALRLLAHLSRSRP